MLPFTGSHRKGRYIPLAALVHRVGARQMLFLQSDLLQQVKSPICSCPLCSRIHRCWPIETCLLTIRVTTLNMLQHRLSVCRAGLALPERRVLPLLPVEVACWKLAYCQLPVTHCFLELSLQLVSSRLCCSEELF